MVVIKGRFKKPHWRRLWRSSQMSREERVCGSCHSPILPGDEYDREVWIWKFYDEQGRWTGKKEVRNYHQECPEDPDEERWRHEQEEFERECGEHEESEPEEIPEEQTQVA